MTVPFYHMLGILLIFKSNSNSGMSNTIQKTSLLAMDKISSLSQTITSERRKPPYYGELRTKYAGPKMSFTSEVSLYLLTITDNNQLCVGTQPYIISMYCVQ